MRLYDLCPAALDRLDVFRRQWLGDGQPEYIGTKRWPGPISLDRDGLREAAEEALACVQAQLHALELPLHLDDAVQLWTARRWSLEALISIGDNRLAKEVEASVSPGGQPLAICIGSAKQEQVTVDFGGGPQEVTMPGYRGCLRTFPDLPFGRGKRWPRLCPACRARRTNDTNAARTAMKRRAKALG